MLSRQVFRFASRDVISGIRSSIRCSPALSRTMCLAKDGKEVAKEVGSVKTENIGGATATPKYQLQPIDKFFLVITGTMKAGQIPNEISFELLEKSQNRRRIVINFVTIMLTFIGSYLAINAGRKARDDHTEDTMFEKNVKRYEKLREEDRLKAEAEASKKA
ncbi:predicted protein [Nematostella vectensis]|uniref:Uncharacterized protein n=1 Tax=Nematostella vectensis TaxID=45351 RepID=A7SJR7_NEMVE|nr:uncharacterized protein LOC5507467 [Nematostella vectensis]EDO36038.1 predicted protein [Nematostella vectensis]|eukprot:XP_001628101.1 predicted protein [Nematostella vectensis]